MLRMILIKFYKAHIMKRLKILINLTKYQIYVKVLKKKLKLTILKSFEVDIKKLNESLFPRVEVDHEKVRSQFCKTILYALRFDKTGLKDMCNKEEFEKTIDKSLVEELNHPEKFQFIIKLQKFHNMCYEINTIISKHNDFLRVFELKNKFRQFTMKNKSKQKIVRQLSSCLIEKYSGFTVISIEFQKNQRKMLKAIDIIYKPTKRIEIESLCYFSDDISKAYSSLYSKGKRRNAKSA